MTIATILHERLAAVAPIASVEIGTRADKRTWRIDFAAGATPAERAAAQAAIDAFDVAAKAAPRFVLARDILDKFSDDDYAAMKAAIAQNQAAARFYDTLLVRGEKAIDLDGERFTRAWGLIVQVLGQARADAIMAALRAEATA